MSSSTVRLVAVVATTVLLQTAVASHLTVAGARVDLYLVLAIAGGLALGPERGAGIGFVAGLLFDLEQAGPMGAGALVYTLAGYLVGSVQRSVVGDAAWAPVAGAAVTAAAAVGGYAAIGVATGRTEWLDARLVTVALVVTVSTALLTPLMVRIMRWTQGEPLGLPRPGTGLRRRGQSGRRRRSSGSRTFPLRSRRW